MPGKNTDARVKKFIEHNKGKKKFEYIKLDGMPSNKVNSATLERILQDTVSLMERNGESKELPQAIVDKLKNNQRLYDRYIVIQTRLTRVEPSVEDILENLRILEFANDEDELRAKAELLPIYNEAAKTDFEALVDDIATEMIRKGYTEDERYKIYAELEDSPENYVKQKFEEIKLSPGAISYEQLFARAPPPPPPPPPPGPPTGPPTPPPSPPIIVPPPIPASPPRQFLIAPPPNGPPPPPIPTSPPIPFLTIPSPPIGPPPIAPIIGSGTGNLAVNPLNPPPNDDVVAGRDTSQNVLYPGQGNAILPFKQRYHPNSLLLFFNSSTYPEWDLVLEANVLKMEVSKEEIVSIMEDIITTYGTKIFVKKRKSDTREELNELIQLQFCVMRNLQMGSRAKTATVKLSDLVKIDQLANGPNGGTLPTGPGPMQVNPINPVGPTPTNGGTPISASREEDAFIKNYDAYWTRRNLNLNYSQNRIEPKQVITGGDPRNIGLIPGNNSAYSERVRKQNGTNRRT